MKALLAVILISLLTGCAGMREAYDAKVPIGEPPTTQRSPIPEMLAAVPPIDGKKITIAVYGFSDKTGQRKPADNIANLS